VNKNFNHDFQVSIIRPTCVVKIIMALSHSTYAHKSIIKIITLRRWIDNFISNSTNVHMEALWIWESH